MIEPDGTEPEVLDVMKELFSNNVEIELDYDNSDDDRQAEIVGFVDFLCG